MNRRNFIRKTGIAATISVGLLAGCTGAGDGEAPPRESEVFSEVNVQENTIEVSLEDVPTVQSRASIDSSGGSSGNGNSNNDTQSRIASALSTVSPVGVASAAKGRGGRGASAGAGVRSTGGAVGRNGRAKYGGGTGGTYVMWWNNHEDDVEEYETRVKKVGKAKIAEPDVAEEDLPGPGTPDDGWDEEVGSPEATASFTADGPGWYRIGSHLVSQRGNHDFGWESVDILLTEGDDGTLQKEEEWKVSPRL